MNSSISSSELRLSDLGGLVNLLHQIANFKSKVMGASMTSPENVFRECIKGGFKLKIKHSKLNLILLEPI